ncbi:hypothetical protein C3L33_03275, partial [Rhododendron williamsianum]
FQVKSSIPSRFDKISVDFSSVLAQFQHTNRMASDAETRAKEAFIDDHFELAVDLYSQAILWTLRTPSSTPTALRPTSNSAISLVAVMEIDLEAVSDASRAIELDPSIFKAYLRKGTACIKLEEYQTAKAALEAGASLAPGDSRFMNLIKECDERIAEENGEPPNQSSNQTQSSVAVTPAPELVDINVETTKDAQLVASSSKAKYRHEFYQKPGEVVVTIFAKGIPATGVLVDFGDNYNDAMVPQSIIVSSGAQRPSYPSSKPRKVDWEKLEAQVKKEEKEEKLDGDAALNKFFRDIYQDADEDTRRAMRKSFVESNGTVLSTNWNEVGSKMVEGSPPDGMEVKKWEY